MKLGLTEDLKVALKRDDTDFEDDAEPHHIFDWNDEEDDEFGDEYDLSSLEFTKDWD